MTPEEYAKWLDDLVKEGSFTTDQKDDLLTQRALFDQNRAELEAAHPGLWVGYVANQKLVDTTMSELLNMSASKHPDRLIYMEQIPEVHSAEASPI